MSDIISSIDWELVLLLIGPLSGIGVFLYLWWLDRKDEEDEERDGQ